MYLDITWVEVEMSMTHYWDQLPSGASFLIFMSISNFYILTYVATGRGFANLTRVPVLLV